ncbi:putative receptor-like protein kinase At4g00960 [Triticum aestivum]|uniref:putative receptor-like protein kinase At4g00960 n=1 Tax=Triticum aestivum TaxID=4565 RepID=UPI000844B416|nr:putative receptor-like protein kinase At4g00960 [Triticum aestivum]
MLPGGYAVLAMIIAVHLLAPAESASMECDGNPQTSNSTFPSTLKLLAAGLPGNASASPNGFASAVVGTAPGLVYGMALCRGGTNASSCRACVAKAFGDAQASCPGDTGAAMYEDGCVLRFSVQRFLDFLGADQWQVREITFSVVADRASVAVSAAWFGAAVSAILAAVSDHAVSSPSPAASSNSTIRSKFFATGEVAFNPRIYGLAQCMPNLAPAQCDGCLRRLQDEATPYLDGGTNPGWIEAGSAWCILRYSVRPIYDYDGQAMLQLQAPPPPSPSATPKHGAAKTRNASGIYAGIASSVVLLLILLSVFAFIRFKRKIKAAEDDNPFQKMARALIFDLTALQEATQNFSEANKLGEGGYGIVYKGILPDGQEIAVKKLLGATEHGLHQLRNEVLLLAELQHKNLVRLQGFCSHRGDTLLVYEYIKNGSLDNFLFDTSEVNTLNWEQQYNIILGIAKGILYLHEDSSPRIIHRDLKANNILLDEEMDPKIADFGLARLLQEGHTHTQTTRAAGTLGYMAPEYAIHGSVSTKIDIFSFGVLVFEIITRRRNCSSDYGDTVNLISDVWNYWTKGTISQMMDESLNGYPRSQALRCIHIGLLCVQPDPDDRPQISTVIFMLTRDTMELQPPAQPAFFFGTESPSPASPRYGQRRYMHGRSRSNLVPEDDVSWNGVTITEPYPR